MNDLLQKIIFYLIVGIPAYILIFYGLEGLGYLQYGGYYTPGTYNPYGQSSFDIGSFLTNYRPTPNIAPFFLVIGIGIVTGLVMRAIVKYSDEDLGVLDMLLVNSEFHQHHCQRTAFLVYAGIGTIVAAIIILIYFNAQFGQNLLMLFGISLSGGIAAVLWYNHEHDKWPWSG